MILVPIESAYTSSWKLCIFLPMSFGAPVPYFPVGILRWS